jgi:hypothetical protein
LLLQAIERTPILEICGEKAFPTEPFFIEEPRDNRRKRILEIPLANVRYIPAVFLMSYKNCLGLISYYVSSSRGSGFNSSQRL